MLLGCLLDVACQSRSKVLDINKNLHFSFWAFSNLDLLLETRVLDDLSDLSVGCCRAYVPVAGQDWSKIELYGVVIGWEGALIDVAVQKGPTDDSALLGVEESVGRRQKTELVDSHAVLAMDVKRVADLLDAAQEVTALESDEDRLLGLHLSLLGFS